MLMSLSVARCPEGGDHPASARGAAKNAGRASRRSTSAPGTRKAQPLDPVERLNVDQRRKASRSRQVELAQEQPRREEGLDAVKAQADAPLG